MANLVASWSVQQRLAEVIARTATLLGGDAGRLLLSLVSPMNLAIMSGTLVIWAGSHFVGIGEIVDVLLLCVGAFTIGWSVTDVAKLLFTFADKTVHANKDRDLDEAASALSRAITLAGFTVIMALLLRRSVKKIGIARGTNVADAMRPRNPGLPAVGNDPAAGRMWSRPGITGDPTLPPGEGSTSPFGEVRISTAGSLTEQALVRVHESVHQFLTPRLGILRTFRVQLGMSAYMRSALMMYLEEALAETVAQLRVVGGGSAFLKGIKFPVGNGTVTAYVTTAQLMSEGAALGTVVAGTQHFVVQFIATDTGDGGDSACYPMEMPAFVCGGQ
jgi:hypothetical protein